MLNALEIEKAVIHFYCVEGLRNRAIGGTGLGLAIVRNIARLYGAWVLLSNQPQERLEVTLHFTALTQN